MSWNIANDAVLAEGQRVLINDPHPPTTRVAIAAGVPTGPRISPVVESRDQPALDLAGPVMDRDWVDDRPTPMPPRIPHPPRSRPVRRCARNSRFTY